jgi:alkanesulfonate monooxygenase SsuD/methylene tetrahydromethanopterin reductase-like flavin-dependent oxidoreductase (luciferase family)
MKIGFKTSQTNVDWPTLLATWELADAELGVFDSGWIFDHFVALGPDAGPCHEGWTVATALAARTRRLQFGHLVLGNTYRQPALLARMAATLDVVANGRFVLGLGAGWHEAEHAMYGWPLPPIGERITMMENAVRVLRALWSEPGGATLSAPPYELRDATCDPPPLTPGGPKIWLGTQGMKRGLRITAELADGWNHTGDPATFTTKRDALLRFCEAAGRDPAEIEISAQVFPQDDSAAMREVALGLANQGAHHLILMMPATAGPDGLRRLATEVAEPLREQLG